MSCLKFRYNLHIEILQKKKGKTVMKYEYPKWDELRFCQIC